MYSQPEFDWQSLVTNEQVEDLSKKVDTVGKSYRTLEPGANTVKHRLSGRVGGEEDRSTSCVTERARCPCPLPCEPPGATWALRPYRAGSPCHLQSELHGAPHPRGWAKPPTAERLSDHQVLTIPAERQDFQSFPSPVVWVEGCWVNSIHLGMDPTHSSHICRQKLDSLFCKSFCTEENSN